MEPTREERIAATEIRKLNQALAENIIKSYSISDNKKEIVVDFNGPIDTKYHDRLYTVRFVLNKEYPFKPAQGFFVGQTPDHDFYRADKDDERRATRTTNLANTDFGIFYNCYTPIYRVADYVKRIQHSLTKEGFDEMHDFMQGDHNYC